MRKGGAAVWFLVLANAEFARAEGVGGEQSRGNEKKREECRGWVEELAIRC